MTHMGNEQMESIPIISDMTEFENAVEAYARDRRRSEYIQRLRRIGLPAHAALHLARHPGRTMCVMQPG